MAIALHEDYSTAAEFRFEFCPQYDNDCMCDDAAAQHVMHTFGAEPEYKQRPAVDADGKELDRLEPDLDAKGNKQYLKTPEQHRDDCFRAAHALTAHLLREPRPASIKPLPRGHVPES